MKTILQNTVIRLAVCLSLCMAAGLQAENVFVMSYQGATASSDVTPCPPSCFTSTSYSPWGSTAISAVNNPAPPLTERRSIYIYSQDGGWSVQPGDYSGDDPANNYYTAPLQTNNAVYKIYVTRGITHSSNIVAEMTVDFGSLADTNGVGAASVLTDAFNGNTPTHEWNFVGYLTNVVPNPIVTFSYDSGTVNNSGNRWYTDVVRFELLAPCSAVDPPGVQGPLASNLTEVVVSDVSSNATAVAVYQDSGSGMVKIGELTSGVGGGVNLVPVTGLVKGAQVSATQTVGGQPSCVQPTGVLVGGGANPRIRVALSLRETEETGPVGDPAPDAANPNVHYVGASSILDNQWNYPPVEGTVLYPSNDWQTLTFNPDVQVVLGNSSNVVGTVFSGGDYAASDSVEVQVYALVYDPDLFINVYSHVGATSAGVTSNGTFGVLWTWDAVPGAEGYRLLRSTSTNSAGFTNYWDVYGINEYYDYGSSSWVPGSTVTPKATTQTGPSVQWLPYDIPPFGNTNAIGTPWGSLEGLALAIDDLTDTGPFDLYIDNLQNGTNVFQGFESFTNGTQEVGFRLPSTSDPTVAFLLDTPNESVISSAAADTGSKSLRIRFQFNGTNNTKWVRLTTSGAEGSPNPLVNLGDPISMRILLLPVNVTPVPPPELSVELVNEEVVVDWEGTYTLLEATNVLGTYTPVPGPVTVGPYTNTPTGDAKFFRLVN